VLPFQYSATYFKGKITKMFELIFGLLALSVPIFYLWGVVAFINTVFRDKSPREPQDTTSPQGINLMLRLKFRARENPNLTIGEFLQEISIRTSSAELKPQETSEVQDELTFEEAVGIETTPRFADLMTHDASPQTTVSWHNWYQDNAINLLLYLGAFLIVAAVALFVAFQWRNFNSITRFSVVALFTLSWYVSGVMLRRFQGLELASITFVTIGAVLAPFCGVAYQRFVVGTMEGMGWTWLITAVVSTIIYLGLSFGYQRRYFTYFGNLSILAMILALVQINDAPQEYFILAGSLTALILLLGRIGLRLAPRLETYLAQDVEYSSLGILCVAVILGLYLVPLRGIDFFSIEVLAVLVVTMLYAWVYSTLRIQTTAIITAQLLTVAAVGHALITFKVDDGFILYATLTAHLVLQWVLNQQFKREDTSLIFASNTTALIVTGVLYLVSASYYYQTPHPVILAVVLMLHSVYFANRFAMQRVFHITAITWYLIAGHLLFYLKVNDIGWLLLLMSVGVIQILSGYAPIPTGLRQALVRVGILGVGIVAITCMMFATGETLFQNNGNLLIFWSLLTLYVGLAVYGLFAFTESSANERLLHPATHVFTAGVAVLCYLGSGMLSMPFVSASLALVSGGLLLLAFRNFRHSALVYAAVASVYATVTHILLGFNLPYESIPITLSLVSVGLFLLEFVIPNWMPETQRQRKFAVLLALAITCFLTFSSAFRDGSLHIAGWVSGYTLIALLWYGRSLFGHRLSEYIIGFVILAQYYWHIVYLQMFVNRSLFNDPQWYFPVFGAFALLMSIRERQRATDASLVKLLELGSAFLFFVPTFGQSFNSGSLWYFLLGIVYSLIFVAVGVMFSQRFMQQIGAVGLIITVLIQTREFLLGLDRWLVVGIIGLALLLTALYLSVRRRGVKRQAT
jgi:hypothetical protein